MTDIVARLRSLNDGNRWPMMDEAADEIERLRGQVETLRELRKYDADEIERHRRALEQKP